ncbi:MAG: 2-oxoglutarate dehydrogenase E1 component, partial [Pseudomonadota bacterium]
KEIVELLGRVYSRSIGAEFTHLSSTRERNWLRQRFESRAAAFDMSADERRRIMRQLTQAEGLERYLHTRYVGQKRFSLEGGESLILLLDEVLQRAGSNGVSEAVIGMAHRGRINVLVNILGKAPLELFSEFEGVFTGERRGSGDVKYHMGFSSDVRTPGGTVHLALAFNPSHLEIVNPVVEGSVRARQERCGDTDGNEVIPILIHGDAAFAGQGVVMETLQMSRLRAFSTGGTFHVICNNQIGFTTSNPLDLRSTPNASDVAKFLEAPVLHVNADDPEAVIVATRVALDYRMTFNKDVVLDLVCYRRLGHNEADEPAATQPLMYEKIRKHPTARAQYAKHLIGEGVITEAEPDEMLEAYRADLEAGKPIPEANLGLIGNKFTADWSPYVDGDITADVPTRIDIDTVSAMAEGITRIPETVRIHNRVARIVADRKRMAAGEIAMDWGFAESMAYASVLNEGYSVRITGQDAGRGTFFHRHAVLHEQDTAALYVPLQHIKPDQPSFRVTDSFLSEEAVLGFEYGFATTEPDALVIWEAQFGDFANGAQVVIDQFISSGESKWGRLCGLTLLLPHGYEGQGPEHSSARLERFLQLCAENNMQVCVPSTPGQMFHMLRRQVVRNVRKPLIVMTPKSLLRHKLSVSPISALSEGRFHHVIDEVDEIDAGKVDRVVFCSGKVYFDLLQARRDKALDSVAIVRIEQLYPFPVDEYAGVLDKYANAKHVVWCQEEPENQGAWYQIRHRLQAPLEDKRELSYAGREGAAAPAAGYYQVHVQQQQALVESALGADASA